MICISHSCSEVECILQVIEANYRVVHSNCCAGAVLDVRTSSKLKLNTGTEFDSYNSMVDKYSKLKSQKLLLICKVKDHSSRTLKRTSVKSSTVNQFNSQFLGQYYAF